MPNRWLILPTEKAALTLKILIWGILLPIFQDDIVARPHHKKAIQKEVSPFMPTQTGNIHQQTLLQKAEKIHRVLGFFTFFTFLPLFALFSLIRMVSLPSNLTSVSPIITAENIRVTVCPFTKETPSSKAF